MTDAEFTKVYTRAVASGVKDALLWLIGLILIAQVALALVNRVIASSDFERDDTDPAGGRSDMRILTDARTSCQYLMASRGGLTPRLDKDGKHMCEGGGQ
jgi:hypothetical protein